MTGPTPPHRPGTALFWAGLLAFVAVDAALLGGLYQGPLAKILSYALIAAFALALAYATAIAIASLAIGHRSRRNRCQVHATTLPEGRRLRYHLRKPSCTWNATSRNAPTASSSSTPPPAGMNS